MNVLKLMSAGLLILMQTCSGGSEAGRKALLGNTWTLASIMGEPVDTALRAPTLAFSEAESRANGFAGCNQFFGTYSLSGDSLSFSGIGSTKMFCERSMELEDRYLDLLGKTEHFVVSEKESTLTLLADAAPVLVFSKADR